MRRLLENLQDFIYLACGVFALYAITAGIIYLSDVDQHKGIPTTIKEVIVSETPDLKTLFESKNTYKAYIKSDVKGKVYIEVLVHGLLTQTSFKDAIKLIETHPGIPVVLDIDSPGGDLQACREFINVLSKHNAPVITINENHAYSCGALLYILGKIRVEKPSSTLLFHSVQLYYQGLLNMSVIEQAYGIIHKENLEIYHWLVKETGYTEEQLRHTLFIEDNENNMISAGKAIDYNILDLGYENFLKIFKIDGIDGVLKFGHHPGPNPKETAA